MKTLFIIPLFLISLVSFPSWGLTIDDLVEREGVYYKKFTNVPFNGKVEGSVVGEFMNGKREGYWLIYWDYGQLSQKGEFSEGKKVGLSKGYWINGQLQY